MLSPLRDRNEVGLRRRIQPDGRGQDTPEVTLVPTRAQPDSRIRSGVIAPGVRLHLLPTDRFTTTICRVVLHRDLGGEATATSLLAHVLESATARHPSREALAHRLADLYGAGLDVGVEKMGDRQLLVGSLDWPTRGVPGKGASLTQGLSFLREVLTEPARKGDGLDPEIVATEATNLRRALAALKDDKARYALRRCLELACEGEPFALDAEGRVEDLPSATPRALAELHARLLARAPVEILLAGDVAWDEARSAVGRHLLWPGRDRRPAALPPAAAVRPARATPRRRVEHDEVDQGKHAMALRAPGPPSSPLLPAAQMLCGVLGGSSVSRLFKVVREVHGLCYYAAATWVRAKGMMLVQSGVAPKDEPKARRMILALTREVAGGTLDPQAFEAVREAARSRIAALRDERGLARGFAQEMVVLGLPPRPETHLARLLAVKPADVRRVGRQLGLEGTFFLTGGKA